MDAQDEEGPLEVRETPEVARIVHLYREVPPMIGASLLGMFLVFVFLFEAVGANLLKAWTAYMLSVLGVMLWLWQAQRNAAVAPQTARRWEYAAACGALLMGLGWGALGGPLFPTGNPAAGDFITLIMVGVAFSAVTFESMSLLCFFAVVLPTLGSISVRLLGFSGDRLSGPQVALFVLLGVLLALQRSQFNAVMDNLRRRVESEALLGEQQAIFNSASQGIALIRGGRIVKCNQRLGEILGRGLHELQALGFAEHFVDRGEFDRTLAESREAFGRNRNYRGLARLRRADGSQFLGDLSARRMPGEDSGNSVWLIGDATTQAAGRPPH
jgi:PAS domain S-box-containing protein